MRQLPIAHQSSASTRVFWLLIAGALVPVDLTLLLPRPDVTPDLMTLAVVVMTAYAAWLVAAAGSVVFAVVRRRRGPSAFVPAATALAAILAIYTGITPLIRRHVTFWADRAARQSVAEMVKSSQIPYYDGTDHAFGYLSVTLPERYRRLSLHGQVTAYWADGATHVLFYEDRFMADFSGLVYRSDGLAPVPMERELRCSKTFDKSIRMDARWYWVACD